MKKIITGMALLLVTTLSAFSQTKNITVSGRVVEDTKEPAIQATVQLLLLPDSVQASGTATTAQGYFTLPKVSAGKYVLKVSYIGFKSQYIPLHLYATTTAKNVGCGDAGRGCGYGRSAASAGGGRYTGIYFICLSYPRGSHARGVGEEAARCGD